MSIVELLKSERSEEFTGFAIVCALHFIISVLDQLSIRNIALITIFKRFQVENFV